MLKFPCGKVKFYLWGDLSAPTKMGIIPLDM